MIAASEIIRRREEEVVARKKTKKGRRLGVSECIHTEDRAEQKLLPLKSDKIHLEAPVT